MTQGYPRIRADRLRASESLYGASRSRRPSDIHGGPVVCPFCPGNEHLSGPLLTDDPGPDWESRVIANLYPAVTEPDGRHEVIVETRAHDVRWASLGVADVDRILGVYRAREAAAYADGHAFVSIFKNSGGAAGASLRHPHAQVVALRRLPLSIDARLERLTARCEVCTLVASSSERIISQTSDVVSYVPNGSRTAFEVRLAPAVHAGRFSESSPELSTFVAATLLEVMKRLAGTLGEDVPFNLVVQSAPIDPRAGARMHWEIEVIPRLENFGGYELGTGGYLVSRPPEEAASILRAVALVAHA